MDVSEGPARLRLENRLLVLEGPENRCWSAPVEEIAVVVLSTEWVRLSAPVLTALAAHGGVLIACDRRGLPVATTLPLRGHTLFPQRLRLQIAAGRPCQKRAWKALVRAKIRAQAGVLRRLHGEDGGLETLVEKVRSGDPENVEAEAARRYWPRVFALPEFRRDPDSAEAPNNLLNYGYAVLRGMVARALVAAGLTPALGLHHRHRENAFALADDLMEPFRPIVDEQVARILRGTGREVGLDQEIKRRLLEPMVGRYFYEGAWRKLATILHCLAARLVDVFEGRANKDWPLPTSWDGVWRSE
ncbi:type II CRISPR-associated endonuclease Cas1 [Limisphaera sp. VF-2]|uniref:type II CRISPR-associated endonuclease Cas1 n=1 Tax=Limisphaera sp. VF-2 TaxID=3400418 RepID=UPI003C1A15A4